MTPILCVADDRNLCGILEKTLTSEGYRVFTTHDGEQALRDFEDCQPELVVLDIMLPKYDGFEVLERIRARDDGQTPVLLMSSCRITSKYADRARALGAQALLAKPVALNRLLEVVKKYTKATPPPVVETSRSKPQLLEGSLSEISFPHLLHHLHGLRATGVLHVVQGRKRKLLQLRDGYPEAIKSNLVNECLGNALVRKGVITEQKFKESVRRMKKGEGLQGQILVAMEVLSEDQVVEALKSQSLEKLFEVFRWTSGTFRFQKGSELQRANSLSMGQSPANLIIEGIRRAYPKDRIDSFMQRNADRIIGPGPSDFYRFQEITFLPAEEEIIARLDGSHALGHYAEAEERLRRTLFGLVVTEFLQLRGAKGASSRISGDRPRHSAAHRSAAVSPPARGESTGDRSDRLQREELARVVEKLRRQTYFEMLGVTSEASNASVSSAFEQAARKVHPDRFANSSHAVKELAEEAYQLLTLAQDALATPKGRTLHTLELLKGQRQAAKDEAERRSLEAELDFQKGEALLKARDYRSALVCFGRSLEANPDEGEYHAHYGWCLHRCHPEDTAIIHEAIEHVRRGIKLSRNRGVSCLYLGRLYKVLGRTAAAEKLFTRALQIMPECVEAIRELRLINLRRDKKGLIGKLLRR